VGAEGDTVVVSGDVAFPARFDRLPVAGGRIQFLAETCAHREFVRIPEDLTYTARLLPGHRYRLRVERLYVDRKRIPGSEFTIEPETFTVPASGPVPHPRLVIRGREGHHRLEVRVRTRGGLPVPGAKLGLIGSDVRNRFRVPLGVAETDRRGVAAFARLPHGRAQLRLLATGPFGRTEQTLGTRRRTDEFSTVVVVGGPDEATPLFVLGDAGALHVTVDTAGLAEAPRVTVRDTSAQLVSEARTRPDVGGSSAMYEFVSLPAGRCRVVVEYPGGRTVYRETDVVSGRARTLLLTRTRETHRGYDLVVRWEAMPAEATRARFFLTRLRGAFETSTYDAVRGAPVRRRYGPELADGPCLLRFPASRLAKRIAPSWRTNWIVDFTPPGDGFLLGGHRTVTVNLTRGGRPVDDLFVGLRRRPGTHEPDADWMRYAGAAGGAVSFDDVPAGFYELHVLDRVLGVEHGVPPQVHRVSVWKEDVTVDWELRDRAR